MAEVRFDYTGADQFFTVPAGVTEIEVEAVAGAGGDGGVAQIGQCYGNGVNVSSVGTVTINPDVYPQVLPGDLALLWVACRWPAAEAPTVVPTPTGWTYVASSPVGVGAVRSTQGHLFSRVIQSGDTTVDVNITPRVGGQAYAQIVGVAGYRDAGATVVATLGDSVGAGSTSWSPSVVSRDAARHHRLAFATSGGAISASNLGSGGIGATGSGNYPTTRWWWMKIEPADPTPSAPSMTKVSADGATLLTVNIATPLPPVQPKGGKGGKVIAKVPVTPGGSVTVYVGAAGTTSGPGNTAISGAYPSDVDNSARNLGGTAGGFSGVNAGGTWVAAGGGGGAGGASPWSTLMPDGGDGGMPAGNGAGAPPRPGTGATTSGAGSPGLSRGSSQNSPYRGGWSTAQNATLLGGGAGGGAVNYRGGGGGGGEVFLNRSKVDDHGGGGGGGCSRVDASATLIAHETGVNDGDGYVIIRWGAVRTGWFLGSHMGGSGWSVS